MEQRLSLRRAFEHELADYKIGDRPVRGPTDYHYYEPIMGLSIQSKYDNGEDGLCTDLIAAPTASTATRMRCLGLLLRPLPNGFSVLYDRRSTLGLFQYLERNATTVGTRKEYWTRLSFTLTVRDPLFVSSTRFPIRANPLADNFYLTNREAHMRPTDGTVRLNQRGAFHAGKRLPVVPVQFPVEMPTGGNVCIHDIAGDVVYDRNRDERPRPPPLPPYPFLETVYIHMRPYPEDKYYLEVLNDDGEPNEALSPGWVIYTQAAPVPLFFIDLLFANPTGIGRGVYPVSGLPYERGKADETPRIDSILYVLQFHARLTTFCYRVVRRKSACSTFRVVSVDSRRIQWTSAVLVPLPDGTTAWEIDSTRPLPLRQQPRYHFRLQGLVGDAWVTVIERLPSATPAAVTPSQEASRRGPVVAMDPYDGPTKSYVYVYV